VFFQQGWIELIGRGLQGKSQISATAGKKLRKFGKEKRTGKYTCWLFGFSF